MAYKITCKFISVSTDSTEAITSFILLFHLKKNYLYYKGISVNDSMSHLPRAMVSYMRGKL